MKKRLFLPDPIPSDGTAGGTDTPSAPAARTRAAERKGIYPCPCCGCLTLPDPPEKAVAYICPVCCWENDVFITSEEEPSDENGGMTLRQARAQYWQSGACHEKHLQYTRKPYPEEIPK